MFTPHWWACAAVLTALCWPAVAAAQGPQPTATPPAEPMVVTTIPAGTAITLSSPVQVVGPAATAPAQRRHPLWNATVALARGTAAVVHGPAVPMPIGCSSFRAEMTFMFGSCRAFYGEYRSPFWRPGQSCGCGDR